MIIDISNLCLCCDCFIDVKDKTPGTPDNHPQRREQVIFLINIGRNITADNRAKAKDSRHPDVFKLILKAGNNRHLFENYETEIASLDMEIEGRSLPDEITVC